ncbi:hypothetical protein [Bradyrhizobium canariense]|uniref:Uncharacterized protein n=1 Tax=Bradyrhizobium canariense TaxID=255045 RepID=A0A1H1PPP6_9BRAD|nr:hypothetical protein [Bradyrhizobium canariense]SDS13118.1 hypothetical protein SAMN05444158_1103 [Bradyrhizobium canariense]
MEGFLKWLRTYGVLGSAAATTVALLAANWVVAVTVAASIYVGLSSWAIDFVHRPDVRAATFVFLVLLWTYIGFTVLIDRRRARIVKSEQDYRYGLTFEGFQPIAGPDFDHDDSELRFGILVRNYSSGPIKYTLDDLDVRIGNRALPHLLKGVLFGFMARGAGRTSYSPAFKRSDFKQLVGQQLEGTAKFTIVYGHPERPPVRRLTISLSIILMIPESGPFGFGSSILEEIDVAIT